MVLEKGGDKVQEAFEEGSHLKEYSYKVQNTKRSVAASGRFNGKLTLP
jgi:hypothetical protein